MVGIEKANGNFRFAIARNPQTIAWETEIAANQVRKSASNSVAWQLGSKIPWGHVPQLSGLVPFGFLH
jgi:hypothetical protein